MNYFLIKYKITVFMNNTDHNEKFNKNSNSRACYSKSKIHEFCTDECRFYKCTNAHNNVSKNFKKYKTLKYSALQSNFFIKNFISYVSCKINLKGILFKLRSEFRCLFPADIIIYLIVSP